MNWEEHKDMKEVIRKSFFKQFEVTLLVPYKIHSDTGN